MCVSWRANISALFCRASHLQTIPDLVAALDACQISPYHDSFEVVRRRGLVPKRNPVPRGPRGAEN